MKRNGFTVIELIITITIMAILLSLAVVNLESTQANARDAERKADTEGFALNLESYYNGKTTEADAAAGTYPGTNVLSLTAIQNALPDIDKKNLYAPDVDITGTSISIVAATTTTTATTSITPKPSKTNDIYVYQPLTASGAICSNPSSATVGACRRFNIYYYQESDNAVHVITSKHQ